MDNVDLSGANLSEAFIAGVNFVGADLSGALLHKATLAYCQFLKANLSKTDFTRAEFFESNVAGSNLTHAIFRNSDVAWSQFKFPTLWGVDFKEAKLRGAVFIDCDFDNVTFERTIMDDTYICDSNFFGSKGIETVVHQGPSKVDFATLLKSCMKSKGCLPPDLKTFLVSAGLPKQLIEYIPQIVSGIKYCSCFVAYGTR